MKQALPAWCGEEGWAFLLLTPDAVLEQRQGWAKAKVEAAGFRLLAGRSLAPSWEAMARMYHHTWTPPQGPPGPPHPDGLPEDLMRATYPLAPGLLLSLWHPQGDAAARLLALKGRTWPQEAAAGSLRQAGPQVVHNLAHCSDDLASAQEEWLFLHDDPALAWGTLAWGALELEDPGPVAWEVVEKGAPGFCGPTTLEGPWVAWRLAWRLGAHWACTLGPTPQARLWWPLWRQALEAQAERWRLSNWPHEVLQCGWDDLGEGWPDPRPMTTPGSTAARAWSAWMDLAQAGRPQDAEALVAACQEWGVFVAPVEALALRAWGHAQWAARARSAGRR